MRLQKGCTMKLFLLGANGRTGREVLRGALDDEDTVTALVRGEDRLADVSHQRLEICVGNPCDSRVLEALLPGHDAVISVLGPRRPSKAASAVYPESAAAIVKAMQLCEVDRPLVTSSALLFPDSGLRDRPRCGGSCRASCRQCMAWKSRSGPPNWPGPSCERACSPAIVKRTAAPRQALFPKAVAPSLGAQWPSFF